MNMQYARHGGMVVVYIFEASLMPTWVLCHSACAAPPIHLARPPLTNLSSNNLNFAKMPSTPTPIPLHVVKDYKKGLFLYHRPIVNSIVQ